MTPRPVGPGRAEWMGAPVAQPQCPTCAAAEAWAARAQRALDEERQRGAGLAAAVRGFVEAHRRVEDERAADGSLVATAFGLRAALAAYEGRGA